MEARIRGCPLSGAVLLLGPLLAFIPKVFDDRSILRDDVIGDVENFFYERMGKGCFPVERSAPTLCVLPRRFLRAAHADLIGVTGRPNADIERTPLNDWNGIVSEADQNGDIGLRVIVGEHGLVHGVRLSVGTDLSKQRKRATSTTGARRMLDRWIEFERQHAINGGGPNTPS